MGQTSKKSRKPIFVGITGGKGGVGKSTFAIFLLWRLLQQNQKVVLCDCDVECPNAYLLLGQKLRKPIKKVFAEFPKLDKRKCRKCGLCVKACKNNAIFQKPGDYPIFIKELCSGCGACMEVCPFGAIKPKKEETGKIYLNEIPNPKFQIPNKSQISKSKFQKFWLVTGIAKEGIEETGPIVKEAKEFAIGFAKKVDADIVLFDTAAGTHCPVINALLGVDFAFLVTEPTPMGEHDLRLMIELCKKLKIKTKIVLNQADLGDKSKIEKIAKNHRIKIEEEIPYSKELVSAYSKGRLIEFLKTISPVKAGLSKQLNN